MLVSDHYKKKYSHHPIQTCSVHLLGGCSELIRFWATFATFSQNDWKGWFPTLIWKSIHAIQFKLGVYTYLVSVQNWFVIGPCWRTFVVATKWMKMMVFDQYQKNYSCNPIQNYFVHLWGECSELTCLWATLAKLWLSSGYKITEIVISDHYLKIGLYTYWVSVQNGFAFGPHWRNFGPLVATKCLKLVVSDCYLKKYSHNTIQTLCLHLLGECSQLICFWAMLDKC